GVHVGTQREVFRRPDHQLAKRITAVHHVEEGQPGVRAWSRKHLEEGAVPLVGWVAVARSAVIAATQPWLQPVESPRLPAGLCGERAGPLRERPPRTRLRRGPDEEVDRPSRCGHHLY